MRKIWLVFWRMGVAYLFYPIIIGLMIYITIHGYHWGFGLALILAIFILDPMWGRIGGNAVRMWKNRKR